MQQILNAMRLQTQRATAGDVVSRIGTVTSYDPTTHQARVTLQPDDVLTGWLPIGGKWVGNGWGMFAPPSIGNLCSVTFTEGDVNGGTIGDRFWNNDPSNPDTPLEVQAGEFWLVHESGAFFKLLNAGGLSVSDGNGATVSMDGQGNITSAANQWTHTGPLALHGSATITGTVTATGIIESLNDVVTGAGISLTNHTHTYSPGSGGATQTGKGVG